MARRSKLPILSLVTLPPLHAFCPRPIPKQAHDLTSSIVVTAVQSIQGRHLTVCKYKPSCPFNLLAGFSGAQHRLHTVHVHPYSASRPGSTRLAIAAAQRSAQGAADSRGTRHGAVRRGHQRQGAKRQRACVPGCTRCTAPPPPATAACPGSRPGPAGRSRGRPLRAPGPALSTKCCQPLQEPGSAGLSKVRSRCQARRQQCRPDGGTQRRPRPCTACLHRCNGRRTAVLERACGHRALAGLRTEGRVQVRRRLCARVPGGVQLLRGSRPTARREPQASIGRYAAAHATALVSPAPTGGWACPALSLPGPPRSAEPARRRPASPREERGRWPGRCTRPLLPASSMRQPLWRSQRYNKNVLWIRLPLLLRLHCDCSRGLSTQTYLAGVVDLLFESLAVKPGAVVHEQLTKIGSGH
jgi:hypothetical protein